MLTWVQIMRATNSAVITHEACLEASADASAGWTDPIE